MTTLIPDKPKFDNDQMVPASQAGKRFGELRKKARNAPQLILDNSKFDSVVLNYGQYESMFMELEALRELTWEMELAQRVAQVDAGLTKTHSMEDVLGEEGMAYLNAIDDTPDDELFE